MRGLVLAIDEKQSFPVVTYVRKAGQSSGRRGSRRIPTVRAERIPRARTEDTRSIHVVQINGNAKDRRQRDEQMTDMASCHHAVVRAP